MIELKDVFASFQRHEVKYLLCGGLAVNLYGIPRMTADIDVIVEWTELNVERFEVALEENGYKHNLLFQLKTLIPASVRLQYFKDKNLIAYSYSSDLLRAVSLDVLTQATLDFKTYWERKEIKYLKTVPVYLLAVDDLIQMKQLANREQDKADIINLKKYYKRD